MKSKWILMTMVMVLVAPLALVTASAEVATTGESNEGTPDEKASPPQAQEIDARAIWRQSVDCTLGRPSDVQGFHIQCGTASFLDARHADGFIAGDHFQSKVKSWDNAPNTAVTTSPGPANVFGVPARVYNYGGTGWNAGITVYLECSYLHGVNVFPAGSFIDLSSDGTCTVTPDPVRSRIDRSP